MAVINSFVNVIAGATVLLGGEPFMDKRIGDGGWTVRRVGGIPLLAIGGVGIVVGYIRNKRVRGQRNDAETFNAEHWNQSSDASYMGDRRDLYSVRLDSGRVIRDLTKREADALCSIKEEDF